MVKFDENEAQKVIREKEVNEKLAQKLAQQKSFVEEQQRINVLKVQLKELHQKYLGIIAAKKYQDSAKVNTGFYRYDDKLFGISNKDGWKLIDFKIDVERYNGWPTGSAHHYQLWVTSEIIVASDIESFFTDEQYCDQTRLERETIVIYNVRNESCLGYCGESFIIDREFHEHYLDYNVAKDMDKFGNVQSEQVWPSEETSLRLILEIPKEFDWHNRQSQGKKKQEAKEKLIRERKNEEERLARERSENRRKVFPFVKYGVGAIIIIVTFFKIKSINFQGDLFTIIFSFCFDILIGDVILMAFLSIMEWVEPKL